MVRPSQRHKQREQQRLEQQRLEQQRIKQNASANNNGKFPLTDNGRNTMSKSNNDAVGQGSTSIKTTFLRLFLLLLLVVVGAGIVTFSRPLQSCILMGQQEMEQAQSTTTAAAAAAAPKLMWDSTNATVMAYATGYHIINYKRFVGSLRNSGFKGHIILAVAPDVPPETENYLKSRNVIYHKVQFVDCTYELIKEDEIRNGHDHELRRCMAPYTNLKARWGRFPLYKDYLEQCATCTGPVLVSDLRDTLFQRDPFGSGDPEPTGLQVFQEHSAMRTDNWIVDMMIEQCKGKDDPSLGKKQPMLCSGTTIGTRQAMLDYLEAMHTEMKLWMATPSCRLKTSADDQSIHNYLFYTGKLPFATAIPNRVGIVHTIGFQAARIHEYHMAYRKLHPDLDTNEEAKKLAPLRVIHGKNQPWIAPQFYLTDQDGFVLDFDGNRSRVIHQYDRFGQYMDIWFNQFSGLVDK